MVKTEPNIGTNYFHFGSNEWHSDNVDISEHEQLSQHQITDTVMNLEEQELHQPTYKVSSSYLNEDITEHQNHVNSVYLPSSISSLDTLQQEFIPLDNPRYFSPFEERYSDIYDIKNTIPETHTSSVNYPESNLPIFPLEHAFESQRTIIPVIYVSNTPSNTPDQVKNSFTNVSTVVSLKQQYTSFSSGAEQSYSNLKTDYRENTVDRNQNLTFSGSSPHISSESPADELNLFVNQKSKINTQMKNMSYLLNDFRLNSNRSL
ncbi:hypothetical protein TNCV_2941111 [Trichonephila clavipes]|nr:hypothetical protein TNCV_2941111 [Trichonephila clavipes]